ncbi:MAG: hypothetical protein K2K77_04190, partial [Duncaniella sp.]|nr:hypothetical protein [Duncaniella sp.]
MEKEKTNVDATGPVTTGTAGSRTPLLDTINSPADLRRLSVEQLPQVCAELRSFLINSLSAHPGHFA